MMVATLSFSYIVWKLTERDSVYCPMYSYGLMIFPNLDDIVKCREEPNGQSMAMSILCWFVFPGRFLSSGVKIFVKFLRAVVYLMRNTLCFLEELGYVD